jgi:PhnB protein
MPATVEPFPTPLSSRRASSRSSRRAVKEGAAVERPGGLKDPCGHLWFIATRTEDVPAEEMKRRTATMKAS